MKIPLGSINYFAGQSKKQVQSMTSSSKYIKTSAYDHAKHILDANGHIVIIGKPGAGKSRLSFQLANDMCSEGDTTSYTQKNPIILDSAVDVEQSVQQQENLVVVVDDLFGKFQMSYKAAMKWSTRARAIIRQCGPLSQLRRNCIILNMRKEIFEKSKTLFEGNELLSTENIIDMDNIGLTEDEKMEMLNEYAPCIKNTDFDTILKTETSVFGYPQCCTMLAKNPTADKFQFIEMLENPVQLFEQEFRRIKAESPAVYLVLCLVFVHGECHESRLDINNSRYMALLGHMQALDDAEGIDNEKLSKAADDCTPFYLNRNDSVFSFAHHTIHDSIAKCLWEDSQTYVIENCRADFLKRIAVGDTSEFIIRGNLRSKLLDRLRSEIADGCEDSLKDVSESVALYDEGFFKNMFEDKKLLNGNFIYHLIRCTTNENVPAFIISNLKLLDIRKILAEACEYNNDKLLNLLLARGILPDLDTVYSAIKGGKGATIMKIIKRSSVSCQQKILSKQKPDVATNILQEICLSGNANVFQDYLGLIDMVEKETISWSELLICGIYGHSLEIVDLCVRNGANLECRSGYQETVLHIACSEACLDIAEFLLRMFPGLKEKTDIDGYTPIFIAVIGSHFSVVELLINNAADIMKTDNLGRTILHMSCCKGTEEMSQYILERFPDLVSVGSNTAYTLHYAAMGGSQKLFIKLTEMGQRAEMLDRDGTSVIHWACGQTGNDEIVKFLTYAYPDLVHRIDGLGWSLLHASASAGSTSVLNHLISKGLDVFQCTKGGKNVLHLACEFTSKMTRMEYIQYLIDSFPDLLHVVDDAGRTGLHYAAKNGSLPEIQLLETVGFDIEKPDIEGKNSLNVACFYCEEPTHMESIKYMISKMPQAFTMKTWNGGLHVVHCAAESGYFPLIEYLEGQGANMNVRDDIGFTVLHRACVTGKLDMAKYIAEKYPRQIAMKDEQENTILHFAAMTYNLDLVKFLIDIHPDMYATNCRRLNFFDACLYDPVMGISEDDKLSMVTYLTTNYSELMTKYTLMCAAIGGSVEIIKYLTSLSNKRLDINFKDMGITILQKVCCPVKKDGMENQMDMVQFLISTYPKLLYMRDTTGRTSLHYAAKGGNIAVLDFLVFKGLNANVEYEGKTVLHEACAYHKLKMVQHLTLAYPQLIHMVDRNNRTALHETMESTSQDDVVVDIVKHLVEKGCPLHKKSATGETPIAIAKRRKNMNAVILLSAAMV